MTPSPDTLDLSFESKRESLSFAKGLFKRVCFSRNVSFQEQIADTEVVTQIIFPAASTLTYFPSCQETQK